MRSEELAPEEKKRKGKREKKKKLPEILEDLNAKHHPLCKEMDVVPYTYGKQPQGIVGYTGWKTGKLIGHIITIRPPAWLYGRGGGGGGTERK